jgi:hypothetical protein
MISDPPLFASALVSGVFLGLRSCPVIGQGASDSDISVDQNGRLIMRLKGRADQ